MQLIQTREALIMDNEIRTAIKKIYGMLWDVLSLYEKTERYNSIPKDEKITEKDIWDFIGDKLVLARKEVDTEFLGNEELNNKRLNHKTYGI